MSYLEAEPNPRYPYSHTYLSWSLKIVQNHSLPLTLISQHLLQHLTFVQRICKTLKENEIQYFLLLESNAHRQSFLWK